MAEERKLPNVTIEDAELIFLNFAGKKDQYNQAGDRLFSVVLPNDVAEAMAADGWNVKYLKAREEGDEPKAYIQITVSYKNKPPQITMITGRSRNNLGEEEIETLDYADILNVDLVINPYFWVVGPNSGVKAYLKTMFVTIEQDDLQRKYAVEARSDGPRFVEED